MIYLRLMLFSLSRLSQLGLWQAGAELDGSEVLRRRADQHRALLGEAARLLRAQLVYDLTRLASALLLPRDVAETAETAPSAQR